MWNMLAIREAKRLEYGSNKSKTLVNLVSQNKKELI
jgi:hypothetical protein